MKGISDVTNLWGREPAMVLGLVQAALALFVVFGIHLSAEQSAAILAFTAAALALLTRSQVTPTSKLPPIAENEPS